MTKVKEIPLSHGGTILVEVYEAIDKTSATPRGVGQTFEAAWEQVYPAVAAVIQRIASLGPKQVQIQFGIKLSSDFNAIISSSKGEANFEVSMTWENGKQINRANSET
jgi:hypothetical protein